MEQKEKIERKGKASNEETKRKKREREKLRVDVREVEEKRKCDGTKRKETKGRRDRD